MLMKFSLESGVEFHWEILSGYHQSPVGSHKYSHMNARLGFQQDPTGIFCWDPIKSDWDANKHGRWDLNLVMR